jgi:hypothetical protein
MKTDTPYAVAIIFAAVAFAVVLMIWSLAGTSGGRQVATSPATTDIPRQTETPTAAAPLPTNDARASSTRATKGPDFKEH